MKRFLNKSLKKNFLFHTKTYIKIQQSNKIKNLKKIRNSKFSYLSPFDNTKFIFHDHLVKLEYDKNLWLLDKLRINSKINASKKMTIRKKFLLNLYYLKKKQYPLLLINFLKLLFSLLINTFLLYRLYQITSKSKNQIKPQKNTKTKFTDIIGIDEFKQELEDITNYMSNRKKFLKSGAIIPKGVLLIGPPGCGKTLLAKAVAGETNLTFYHASASDFVQPIVGEGSEIIKNLFAKARNDKGAIIFIDEIDSLVKRNEYFGSVNSNVNQLLTEMDGFRESENVLVIAATNREKSLDKALVRSGRFDLKIRIRLPVKENRRKLLEYFVEKVKYDPGLDLERIVRKTVGFSPVEIKNLVNIAIMGSIKKKKFLADDEDFGDAFERIKLGVKRKGFMKDEKLKEIVALKEATKAVISHFERKLPDVDKVSILAFGDILGKSILIEKNDITNYTKQELLLRIEYFLAAKAMEEVFLEDSEFTSFSRKDVKRALGLATRFVTVLGMEEDFSLVSIEKKYLSEGMKRKVEEKAKGIVDEAYLRVREKIIKHKNVILDVKNVLKEKEEIDANEFLQILKEKKKNN